VEETHQTFKVKNAPNIFRNKSVEDLAWNLKEVTYSIAKNVT
jgi:hypothetical protein